jgi:putative ABC transport system substrate-binding protein
MPVIGLLQSTGPEEAAAHVAAFRKGLSETGYEEGRNVKIEYRWAGYDNAKLPELAADLVRRRVAVIAAPASTPAALAAKASTRTIPVVFSIGTDPVEIGLVPSLNRPGSNVTGLTSMNIQHTGKQLGLLHELSAASFAVLINPSNRAGTIVTKDAQEAGAALGRQIVMLTADSPRAIIAAFAALKANHADGLLVSADIVFDSHPTLIATLAARDLVPTISFDRSFAEAGGLMSYGTSVANAIRQTGILVGRILKGEKPADMPVARPTKFEFVINLLTATVIGLDVPATLTARADEVIE